MGEFRGVKIQRPDDFLAVNRGRQGGESWLSECARTAARQSR